MLIFKRSSSALTIQIFPLLHILKTLLSRTLLSLFSKDLACSQTYFTIKTSGNNKKPSKSLNFLPGSGIIICSLCNNPFSYLTHDICLLFFSCLQQTNLIPRTLQGSVFDHSNNTEQKFTYKFISLYGFYYIYLFHPSISLRFDKQQLSIFCTKLFQSIYTE
jgi:hypothetical protein